MGDQAARGEAQTTASYAAQVMPFDLNATTHTSTKTRWRHRTDRACRGAASILGRRLRRRPGTLEHCPADGRLAGSGCRRLAAQLSAQCRSVRMHAAKPATIFSRRQVSAHAVQACAKHAAMYSAGARAGTLGWALIIRLMWWIVIQHLDSGRRRRTSRPSPSNLDLRHLRRQPSGAGQLCLCICLERRAARLEASARRARPPVRYRSLAHWNSASASRYRASSKRRLPR